MIRYVPSSVAATLSAKLWGLARPPDVRAADEGTVSLFPVVVDLNGNSWLMVDTDYTITVHPEAELDGIADILQPWIDSGHLPADTNTNLAAQVLALRGLPLVVYDAFPALFKSLSLPPEEMLLPVPP